MEQNRRRRDLLGVRCTFPRVKNCFLRYEKDVSLHPKGLDLNVTRPLAVLLSEIAVEDKTASKISGQFRKAKLRRGRGSTAVILSNVRCPPALLRVTIGRCNGSRKRYVSCALYKTPLSRRFFNRSAVCRAIGCGLKGSVSTPTLKTASPFFQP